MLSVNLPNKVILLVLTVIVVISSILYYFYFVRDDKQYLREIDLNNQKSIEKSIYPIELSYSIADELGWWGYEGIKLEIKDFIEADELRFIQGYYKEDNVEYTIYIYAGGNSVRDYLPYRSKVNTVLGPEAFQLEELSWGEIKSESKIRVGESIYVVYIGDPATDFLDYTECEENRNCQTMQINKLINNWVVSDFNTLNKNVDNYLVPDFTTSIIENDASDFE